MPNVMSVLREEIGRLSRKEMKKAVPVLRTRVAMLIRALAVQKRQFAGLNRKVVRLESLMAKAQPAVPAASPEEVKKARISARLIKAQRRRLKISQQLFAKLLGVSPGAVRGWEQGRTSPRGSNIAAFVSVRRMKKREVYERLGIVPKRKKRGRRLA
ncbi:MAG: helix-turn-helix domain-containing protein [Candidatus Aureabacteria bacterium]|nr:helix-turn-helix domain-containing protein [Candidatus Auribacterota bacterium]